MGIYRGGIMSKALSLKLWDNVYRDVETITHKIKVPRNTYINNALAFYNEVNQRSIIKKKLQKESKLVSKISMDVLKEFERFEETIL